MTTFTREYSISDLEDALTDVLDGYDAGDLMGHGLAVERADEIVELVRKVFESQFHGGMRRTPGVTEMPPLRAVAELIYEAGPKALATMVAPKVVLAGKLDSELGEELEKRVNRFLEMKYELERQAHELTNFVKENKDDFLG